MTMSCFFETASDAGGVTTWSRGFTTSASANPPSSQDPLVLVQDDRLTRGDSVLCFVKIHANSIAFEQLDLGQRRLVQVADLSRAFKARPNVIDQPVDAIGFQ